MAAIGAIESGGGKVGKINYDAVGPTTKGGHRALGAWQVMDFNVAAWTKEAGYTDHLVTAEEFQRNQEMQYRTVHHQIEKLANQGYDIRDIASIWHSGSTYEVAKRRRARDVNMQTTAYADQVSANFITAGQAPALASRTSLKGMPLAFNDADHVPNNTGMDTNTAALQRRPAPAYAAPAAYS